MQENGEHWRTKLIQPRLPWLTRPVLPADLGQNLCSVILARENLLEDAHYQKVVPNRFRVEVNPENFSRNYQPLAGYILQQWQVKLSECLATANTRLGRKEYVLAGKVNIEIRPASDLLPQQARIHSLIQPDQAAGQPNTPALRQEAPLLDRLAGSQSQEVSRPKSGNNAPPIPTPGAATSSSNFSNDDDKTALPCLEQFPDGRIWLLYAGTSIMGRLETCDIVLNSPEVTSRRLISGQHAYLQTKFRRVLLYDGSPNGRPSLNGTYVNRQRIFAAGYELHDGDIITLAATNPADPHPDAPGVVTFRFRSSCTGPTG